MRRPTYLSIIMTAAGTYVRVGDEQHASADQMRLARMIVTSADRTPKKTSDAKR